MPEVVMPPDSPGEAYEQQLEPDEAHPGRPEAVAIEAVDLGGKDLQRTRRPARVKVRVSVQPRVKDLLMSATGLVAGALLDLQRKQGSEGALEQRDVRLLVSLVDAIRKLGQEEREAKAGEDLRGFSEAELEALAAAAPAASAMRQHTV